MSAPDEKVWAENADVIAILVANLTTIAEGEEPADIGTFHSLSQPEAGLLIGAAMAMISNLNYELGDGGVTLLRYARHIGMRAQKAVTA